MFSANVSGASKLSALADAELVELARRRDPEAVRFIIQRHNQRLFRVARSVLRDDSEAEDVVQEVYVKAFTALATFRGESSVATWLTRIALNEALGRRRQQRTTVDLTALDVPEQTSRQIIPFPTMRSDPNPEEATARHEIRQVLERAIDALAEPFRLVFVMRDVEGMSVEETAAQLGLRPETVRTRLHRARAQLRDMLRAQVASVLTDAFPFAGARCARVAEAVIERLGGIGMSDRNDPTQEETS